MSEKRQICLRLWHGCLCYLIHPPNFFYAGYVYGLTAPCFCSVARQPCRKHLRCKNSLFPSHDFWRCQGLHLWPRRRHSALVANHLMAFSLYCFAILSCSGSNIYPNPSITRNFKGRNGVQALRENVFFRGLGRRTGGAKRNRTADLLNAIQALSQLSYGPTVLSHIDP